MNELYYGDNLEIMRNEIPDESVDLCYIDPPFNSKRNYNLIYNNIGEEKDKAQAEAFSDTWVWNARTQREFEEICKGQGFIKKTSDLIRGFHQILNKGSLLSYLVSMTVRIKEIHRVLKPTGSFYLHCDPTASHYLKLVLDAIFCGQGGDFKNEIIWSYKSTIKVHKSHLGRDHDIIFFYTKGKISNFHPDRSDFPVSESTLKRWGKYADETGFVSNIHRPRKTTRVTDLDDETKGFSINQGIPRDVWDISIITGGMKEKMGYATQKPEKLLERIIKMSSDEGDVVLDAFCGCGTTIAVAEKLNRKWIGIDISYFSVQLIQERLRVSYGDDVLSLEKLVIGGIPRSVEAARALAERKDDLPRKEFEKWAILTYTNNEAMVNNQKGADGGFDGTLVFDEMVDGEHQFKDILFSVKSGKVGVKDIREFCDVVEGKNAAFGVFITLEIPTVPMLERAVAAGTYSNDFMHEVPKIKIITIKDMLEKEERLNIKLSKDMRKKGVAVVIEDRQAGKLE